MIHTVWHVTAPKRGDEFARIATNFLEQVRQCQRRDEAAHHRRPALPRRREVAEGGTDEIGDGRSDDRGVDAADGSSHREDSRAKVKGEVWGRSLSGGVVFPATAEADEFGVMLDAERFVRLGVADV